VQELQAMVSAPTIWRQDLFAQMSASAASDAQAIALASFNSGRRWREQFGREAPTGLVLEVEVAKGLPVLVADDERLGVLLDYPSRRAATNPSTQLVDYRQNANSYHNPHNDNR
jgi:hypothetical protein